MDNSRELAALKSVSTPFEVPKGEMILLSGEIPDYVYCLLRGEAQIQEILPSGEWRAVRYIEGTEIIGDLEIITGQNLLYSVFARTDCFGIRISASKFRDLLKTDASLSFEVLKRISTMLINTSSKRVSQAGYSSVSRVALCILENCDSQGNLLLTKQEISNFTRASLRTVFRAIKILCDKGLLKNQNRKLSVPNRGALFAFTDSISAGIEMHI